MSKLFGNGTIFGEGDQEDLDDEENIAPEVPEDVSSDEEVSDWRSGSREGRNWGSGDVLRILARVCEHQDNKRPSSRMIEVEKLQTFLAQLLLEAKHPRGPPAVTVIPYRDTPERGVHEYRVRRVVSPFEFILELVLDGPAFQYQQWSAEMQRFYDDLSLGKREALEAEDVIQPRACYVYKDPEDEKWHRVRVHGIHYTRNTAELYFIDRCLLKDINIDNRRFCKMTPAFARFPAPLFRCYLYDIAPKCENDAAHASPLTPWSEAACEYFKDALLHPDKVFKGIVFTRSEKVVTPGAPDVCFTVGIVLLEKTSNCCKPKNAPNMLGCTVNAQMVDRGYAVATGMFGCCQHTLRSIDSPVPSFPHKKFELLSPPESLPPKTPLMSFNDTTFDAEGDTTRVFLHRTSSHPYFNYAVDHLPAQFASHLCQVSVYFIRGPGVIILHMKNEQDALIEMQNSLEQEMVNAEPLGETELLPGTLVACHIPRNVRDDTIVWCRAVVNCKMRKETGYQVILIDYGNDMTVAVKDMRLLPEYFMTIPSFALRVHLDVPWCLPKFGPEWSSQANVEFRKHIFARGGDEPIFYIHRPLTSYAVRLEHFSQDVVYNRKQGRWIPGRDQTCTQDQIPSTLKDSPLLRTFYVSYGVQLSYEVEVARDLFWHFTPISDHLCAGDRRAEQAAQEDADLKRRLHQQISLRALATAVVSKKPEKPKTLSIAATQATPAPPPKPPGFLPSLRPPSNGNLLRQTFIKNKIIPPANPADSPAAPPNKNGVLTSNGHH